MDLIEFTSQPGDWSSHDYEEVPGGNPKLLRSWYVRDGMKYPWQALTLRDGVQIAICQNSPRPE